MVINQHLISYKLIFTIKHLELDLQHSRFNRIHMFNIRLYKNKRQVDNKPS